MSHHTGRELNGPNSENYGRTQKHTYTRADLLAMRYDDCSRQRPNCSNRTELQKLNFWKINVIPQNWVPSNNENKNCATTETDNSSLANSNGLASSRRSVRNRERANNYYQRFVSGYSEEPTMQTSLASTTSNNNTSSNSTLNTPYKSSNIDHRSMSSSHLMPAFAKRRFAATSGVSAEANELQNEKSDTLSNCEDDGPNSGGSVAKERNGSVTPANSEQQQQLKSHVRPPGSSLVSLSPIRKGAGSSEWERSDKRVSNQQDYEQSSAPSPTFSATRHGNLNMPERRIGSGRLLPRDANWEYKNQDAESSSIQEKERGAQHGNSVHQRQRTFSGRHMERSNDNMTDRRVSEGRRPVDGREQYENKRTVQGQRRTQSKDKFNFGDGGGNQGRGKRSNNYHMHDRHEEPEWFSAGPTSQLETIDLHGFDDLESTDERGELENTVNSESKTISQKENQATEVPATASRSSSTENVSDQQVQGNLAFKPTSDKDECDKNAMTNFGSNKPTNSLNPAANSEVEFNFDAFLNLDPMDHNLMGNDNELQGEMGGTSRFSRWFDNKVNPNNADALPASDSNVLNAHSIPSVKDLEAQMTKVDLRPESAMGYNNPMADVQVHHKEHAEKPVPRDTEGFKKLLQQLRTQNQPLQPPTVLYQLTINTSALPKFHPNRAHMIEPQHNLCPINEALLKDDDLQKKSYQQMQQQQQQQLQHQQQQQQQQQQQMKQNERMQQRNMDFVAQGPSPIPHPQFHLIPNAMAHNVHEPTASNLQVIQNQKRIEIQNLIQNIARGEVPIEFLEQEIHNPNTSAHVKEIIGHALRECGRNSVQQKLTYQKSLNDLGHHNLVANQAAFQQQNVCPNVPEEMPPPNAPCQGLSQQLRHTNSPTPLAFTPTAVLRKMTADKDAATPSHANNANNPQYHYQFGAQQNKLIASHNMANAAQPTPALNMQPRMILGGNYAMQQQQQQQQQHPFNANSPQISPKLLPQMAQARNQAMKWPANVNAHAAPPKSLGRPILKGPVTSVSQQMPLAFASKLDMQQMHQQRLKATQGTEQRNEHLHAAPPPHPQNFGFADGVPQLQQQQQHQHFLQQQQQQQQQQRQQARHIMLQVHIGDNRQQANLPMKSTTPGVPDSTDAGNLSIQNYKLMWKWKCDAEIMQRLTTHKKTYIQTY
ncbi:alpha-protein kinase 1 isoform X2 [Scaptodrosophila lebanonensis]|uniref:Alpha-protein kinase 1 isoform X2 n=1 Tax=Drosophila lebanonensis TaxID=7225 RepID=A0A6J2TWI0_DROLE|nr:alpha-protein kinase 1 isoform X2 [Scaptodrosophila lebanonensis]